jgi:hypothetical protein
LTICYNLIKTGGRWTKVILPLQDRVNLALEQAEKYWGVNPKAGGKHRRTVRARWSAAYLLRRGCYLSLTEVARILMTSAATVVYAVRMAEEVGKLEGWWEWLERTAAQLRGMG